MREPRWRRSCGPGPSLSPLGPGSGTGDGQKEEAETLQAQMKPSSPPVCLTLPQCLCCLFSHSLASLSKLYTTPGSTRLEPRAPREFFSRIVGTRSRSRDEREATVNLSSVTRIPALGVRSLALWFGESS
ncbi:hypothetical protein IscW_ISCW019591 [Ixodes scapularis]|uniref:Uncharacterized protein n=1 Tax=Ixodes scapularis TaxID=6945 RepID=B7PV82_IXOSC|nr:hypothetical protein IscW_ISCW019591 [Ixodes scapularis]|eukprot:XP_002407535.1 hypothetical protein IscW_ISCW019591 [Ixodes scapularis]